MIAALFIEFIITLLLSFINFSIPRPLKGCLPS